MPTDDRIPSFLLDILAREMYESHARLLREVGTALGHDPEALIARFLPGGARVRVVPDTVERVRVVREIAPRGPPSEMTERCMARTWNRGNGGQCTRRRAEGSEYCQQHQERRKHGRVDEKKPQGIFVRSNNKKELYTPCLVVPLGKDDQKGGEGPLDGGDNL